MIRRIRHCCFSPAACWRSRRAPRDAQLKVVTSTTDLYDIAKAVGGDKITAHAHRRGLSGPALHRGEAELRAPAPQRRRVGVRRPRSRDRLDAAAARRRAQPEDPPGRLGLRRRLARRSACSTSPRGNVDRSQGDVHPLGNPHYWLDPENGRRIARLFQAKFSRARSEERGGVRREREGVRGAARRGRAGLGSRSRDDQGQAGRRLAHELALLRRLHRDEHRRRSWSRSPACRRRRRTCAGLIQTIKRTGAKVIIMEPFYDRKIADLVAQADGRQGAHPAAVGRRT